MNIKQMRNFFTFFFALILAMGCLSVSGQVISDADNQIIEKIKQENAKYTSITSDFSQTRHLAVVAGDVISSGKFYYLKPESLAMHYSQPAGDLMLIAGDLCYMIAGGKTNKVSAKSNAKMRKMKTILSACLQGDVKQMEYKKITCKETEQYYQVVVEIDGKNKHGVISKVSISYDKADYSPSILKTEESDGSFTSYSMTGKQLNQPVDADVFKVKNTRRSK